MNLPNQLTIFRVILIPAFIVLLMSGHNYYATAVFCIASFTDFLDGYIARKNNLVTNFGKIMDPLADKLLVMAAFVCMVELSMVASWTVIVILAREFTITALRTVAASEGIVIAAGNSGKLKTVFQMVSIILLLLEREIVPYWLGISYVADFVYGIAVALTIVSGVEYIIKNKAVFKA